MPHPRPNCRTQSLPRCVFTIHLSRSVCQVPQCLHLVSEPLCHSCSIRCAVPVGLHRPSVELGCTAILSSVNPVPSLAFLSHLLPPFTGLQRQLQGSCHCRTSLFCLGSFICCSLIYDLSSYNSLNIILCISSLRFVPPLNGCVIDLLIQRDLALMVVYVCVCRNESTSV